MADNPLPRYFFAVPPKEYDQNYMREVVRAFSLFQEQLTNPGKVTANELNLKPEGGGIKQFANNVEAYNAGLQPGDMWMLSTGEVRIVIDPNIDVPVSIEYFRSGTGQVGQVITFDASAEIDDVIHFMADGQVGSANAVAVYSITGTAAAATSGVGAVTTAFAYSFTGTAASATSGVGTVTIVI
tara:strand:+ start:1593 stop:2144 length:552 start_codon:yes stop_codon:yes gene_type:complete